MNEALPTWHLNLTRTLADVWGLDTRPPEPAPKPRKVRKRKPRMTPSVQRRRTYVPRWPSEKIPYAGKEPRRRAKTYDEGGMNEAR